MIPSAKVGVREAARKAVQTYRGHYFGTPFLSHRIRAHVLPALVASDKSKAEDALVAAVKSKMLTLDEATALAAEFGIGQE